MRLLFDTMGATMAATDECAERRPVRTVRRLTAATRRLAVAAQRVLQARTELAEASECLSRAPEAVASDAPLIVELALERCKAVAAHIPIACSDVIAVQIDLLGRLRTGALTPEPPSARRPRIILAPRPVPIRAFLALRQARVAERIMPILRRRRRTLRPAETRVPRRNLRGVLLLSLRPACSDRKPKIRRRKGDYFYEHERECR